MRKPTPRVPLTAVGAVVALVLPFVAAVAVVATSGQAAGANHTATRIKPGVPAPTKSPKKKPPPTTPPPTTPPPTTPPPTTPPPTTPPPGGQTCDVVFEGQAYCPGFIVGVTTGAYGAGAKVVLQSVTVWEASGSHVTIAGGPACLPDPSGGPVFCGDIVPTLAVDFPASTPPPGVGAIIDVYGTTTSTGGLDPAGYVLIGCDPSVGVC